MQFTATISARGQIIIPLAIREVMGIKTGDYVTVDVVRREKVPGTKRRKPVKQTADPPGLDRYIASE